jgi:hypothetical protein
VLSGNSSFDFIGINHASPILHDQSCMTVVTLAQANNATNMATAVVNGSARKQHISAVGYAAPFALPSFQNKEIKMCASRSAPVATHISITEKHSEDPSAHGLPPQPCGATNLTHGEAS